MKDFIKPIFFSKKQKNKKQKKITRSYNTRFFFLNTLKPALFLHLTQLYLQSKMSPHK